MPADVLTLSADQLRGILDTEPNENWDKLKRTPRVTYTPPEWMTGKRAYDHTSAWASGLKDAVLNGDLKGVLGSAFTPPLNLADFVPNAEEIATGEDDLVKMGWQDENSAKWKKRLLGGARGAINLGSDVFLSPGNAALGGAMGALGKVARTAKNPLVSGAAGLTKAAATGKFAVDAGHGVVEAGDRFAEAKSTGDDVGMGAAVTEGIGNTAMLGLAGSHAATEVVHATSNMLAASPELQKVHAQITGLVKNPGDMQTAMNAIATAMASNGGDVMAAAAPVLRSLYHWSSEPRDVVDPKHFGEGKPGAEMRRKQNDPQNFLDRYSAWDTPEANERGFGPGSPRPFRHRIDVPEEKLYDIVADPQGFRQTGDFTLAEKKAIKEAGYSGIFVDDGSGTKQYAMFEPAEPVEIAKFNSYDQPPEILKTFQPEQLEQVDPAPESTHPDYQLAKQIADAHAANGGSSFHLNNGDLAGSNKYMVSIFPEASEILDAPPTPEQLAAYIEKHRATLQDPNVALGTWADEGKHYLDLSAAVDDRGAAEHLGQKYNQKGIGQLVPNGFDYIPTGGTGEGVGFEAPAMHERLARELEQYRQPPAVEAPPAVEPAPEPEPTGPFIQMRRNPAAFRRDGRRLVPDVARQLQSFGSNRLDGVTTEGGTIRRFLRMAEPEVNYQVKQPQSGLQWYEEDIGHMEKGMQQLHPELADPHKMGIFKALLAITSNGQKPNTNLPLAERLYSEYKKSGKIPARQEDGRGWTQRGADNEMKISILNGLIEKYGEEGASKWLLEKHTVKELRGFNGAVSGKAGSEAYGYRVLGPKLGIFGLNINGISENLTKDMWWSRTWNRYMGTLVEGNNVVEAPRNDAERLVMDKAAARLSQQVGLPISKIQAVLWYYEKQLYEALGARSESESFKDITDKILRQRGVRPPADGAGGPGASKGGADAAVREGAAGDQVDTERDAPEPTEPPSRPAHPASTKLKKAR